MKRIRDLEAKGVNVERLLTAAVGISAGGGEFTEIVKKICFQGKELTPENKVHLYQRTWRYLLVYCSGMYRAAG